MYSKFINISLILPLILLLSNAACTFKKSEMDPYFAPGFTISAALLSASSNSSNFYFGQTAILESSDLTITVTNSGTRNARNISMAISNSEFIFKDGIFPGTGGTCSTILNSLNTCTVVLSFLPTSIASYSVTMVVSYLNEKDPETQLLNISLMGTGISVAPTVTNISPSSGTNAGGTSITITGGHFRTGMTVTLGGTSCTNVNVTSLTSLTCTTGAHTVGYVDAVLTNDQNQTGTLSYGFAYVYATGPTLLSISPNRVSIDGGTTITITGNNLIVGATATIGGNACTSVSVASSSSATCVTPSGTAGTSVDLIWINPGALTDTYTNGITYAVEVWTATTTSGAPSIRYGSTSLWTGSKAIFWGGVSSIAVNTGGQYDPVTDSWSSTTTTNAPSQRYEHTAIWTGSKMIIWGGTTALFSVPTGGQYDPVLNSWTATNSTTSPEARSIHTAVWTGAHMLIWGGVQLDPGNISGDTIFDNARLYDPVTNTWGLNLSTLLSARTNHSAIWTGNKMIIWGGIDISGAVNDGAIYNPANDTWAATSTTGAPSPRSYHAHVWTGSKMIIWGGQNAGFTNNGGIYDPNTDTWTSTTTTNAPPERASMTFDWTGNRMIIWGGFKGSDYHNSGGLYDPATNSWTATTTIFAPEGRSSSSGKWTGSKMIVFSGLNSAAVNTGGVYTPPLVTGSNAWTAATTTGMPTARSQHRAVWTGSKMIVWGGLDLINGKNNTGGLYDPVTNSWSATTTTGAPAERDNNSAVWTGSKMIVWGGRGLIDPFLNTGGEYDPILNSWIATTTTNAPPTTSWHAYEWTGSKMIVWGGKMTSISNGGGIYDPTTSSWTATTTTSAPSIRFRAKSVWTGSKMIIWGGHDTADDITGGIYNPTLNTWTSTSTVGTPNSTYYHSMIWTGSKMITWGGIDFNSGLPHNTGGLYDPENNTWTSVTTTDAPSIRNSHTAIWTGSRMIIYGGFDEVSEGLTTGGSYNPVTDKWSTIADSTTITAAKRGDHSAIWTGGKMIIFSGDRGSFGTLYNDAYLYTP